MKYYSGDKIKRTQMDMWHVWKRNGYRVLVAKSEGRRPLGKSRCKWEDNIKMDFRELGQEHGLDGPGSGWGQMVSFCECGNERSGSIKCREFIDHLRTC
jgi:hypothetical protein